MPEHHGPARTRTLRVAVVAAVTAVLALLLGAAASLPADDGRTARGVDDAVLTWGLNAESSGGAYFGGCNFLSAGVAGSTGGSRPWTQGDGLFSPSQGAVSVRKPTSSGALGPVTWATRCENAAGAPVNGRTTSDPGSSTGMVVQVTGGTGWVDQARGTAIVRWRGSFTVVYYGGMTYWSATDPVLVVRGDGTGTLSATLSGYAADREDPTRWVPVPPRAVTMATLTDVDVSDAAGLEVTPDFLGVVADTRGGTAQELGQPWSGAFPADFLAFQRLTGQHPYWYTTAGGSSTIQPRKVAAPVRIGYVLGGAVDVPPDERALTDVGGSPTSSPTSTSTSSPTASPTGAPGPTTSPTTGPTTSPTTSPTSTPAPTASPSPTGGPTPMHEFEVDDAQLRWGLNTEVGAGAYFGGCHFLSAGVAGDAGRAHVWTQSDGLYAARAGDVRIEKPGAGGAWTTASWATRCLDADGREVSVSNGAATRSQVVMDGGTGVVDPVAGTARVTWAGGFTVALYGGMTYWSAQEPVLDVAADGTGTLTAQLSGWATDMSDTTRWIRLPPRPVVLADLTDVELDAATGLVVLPDYLGVAVETGAATPQAERTASNAGVWGAFPQSFVDFQARTGQAAYWYTSGAAADAHKPTTELRVTWTPTDPDPVPRPTPGPPGATAPAVAPAPPAVTPPPVRLPPSSSAAGPVPAPVARPVAADADGSVAGGGAPPPAVPVGTLVAAPAASTGRGDAAAVAWWIGGAALLGAAVLVVPARRR